jgi:hypothetical protein
MSEVKRFGLHLLFVPAPVPKLAELPPSPLSLVACVDVTSRELLPPLVRSLGSLLSLSLLPRLPVADDGVEEAEKEEGR